MNTHVCCVKDFEPNNIQPSSALEGKNALQILDYLGYKNEILAIDTPFLRKKLDPKSFPLKDFPNLILEKRPEAFPPTDYHLRILSPDKSNIITLKVKIETQLNDEFPLMCVDYDTRKGKKYSVRDFITECSKIMNFDCSNQRLLDQDQNEIDTNTVFESLLKSAEDHNLTFNCNIGEKYIKMVKMRTNLSNEIVTSEQAFVRDLKMLQDYWEPAISKAEIFDKLQIRTMFRNIPKMLKTHSDFLNGLSAKPSFSFIFGPMFIIYQEKFKISAAFVSNFEAMDKLIRNKRQSKSVNSKLIEIEDNNPANDFRDFLSYYVTPVQRYPRYPLLVRDLDKYTPNFHPDKPFLSLALKTIDGLNKDIDYTSHRVKQLVQMNEIQEAMKDSDFLVQEEGREIILQAKVRISKPSGRGILYLFNDVVVLALKQKKSQIPLIVSKIMSFRFVNNKSSVNSFSLLIDGKEGKVHFDNYEDKMQWMESFNMIRQAQFDNYSSNVSFIKWLDVEVSDAPAVMSQAGCVLNNVAYFIGGKNSSLSQVNTIVKYNIDSNSWSHSSSKLPLISSGTATTLNDTIYYSFGEHRSTPTSDIWKMENNSWVKCQINGTHVSIARHSCIAYKDSLYYFGGKIDRTNLSNKIYVYNTKTYEMNQISDNNKSSPSPRCNHCAVLVDDSMIIIGGSTSKHICGSIYEYNLISGKWSKKQLKITPRIYHQCIVQDNYIFVIGGINDNQTPNLEIIDYKLWELVTIKEIGNIPFGNSRFSAVSIGRSRILTYGGIDSYSKTPFCSSYIIDSNNSIISLKVENEHQYPIKSNNLKEIKTTLIKSQPLFKDTKPSYNLSNEQNNQKKKPFIIPKKSNTMAASSPQKILPLPYDSNVSLLFEELNIHIEELDEAEQRFIIFAAQKLIKLRTNNDDYEAKIYRLSLLINEPCEIPANLPITLKVYNDSTQTTTILQVKATISAEQLILYVKSKIQKEARFSFVLKENKMIPVNSENWSYIIHTVCQSNLRFVNIIAFAI